MDLEIVLAGNRFIIGDDNEPQAYIAFSTVSEAVVSVDSTWVSDGLKGQGIAALLVEKLIVHARSKNWKLIPVCPYVVKYFEKHQGYEDILVNSNNQKTGE